MNQYLLSVWHDGDFPEMPEDEMQATFEAVDAFNQKVQDEGAWVFAGGLHDRSTATVVRVEEGEAILTDGPFAEGKEQIGGFWVIAAPDLDAALEWGRKLARATTLPIEVRPFREEH